MLWYISNPLYIKPQSFQGALKRHFVMQLYIKTYLKNKEFMQPTVTAHLKLLSFQMCTWGLLETYAINLTDHELLQKSRLGAL